MKILIPLFTLLVAGTATQPDNSKLAPRKPKLRIYILAGQSNMEGKGHVRHITWLKENAATAERKVFERVHSNDKFSDIKRVFIRYKNNIGPLTVGFGSNGQQIGPEYGFGITMAEAAAGNILLLKVSEGGKTLKTEFLPPSSGGPGRLYGEVVDMVNDAKSNLSKYVPGYGGRGYTIEGLVWFQGFNDNIDREQKAEGFKTYAERLDNLLKDLRRDLDAPDMKMVIGQLGFNKSPSPFNKAQMSVAALKHNSQSVRYVPIVDLADPEVIERFKTWKKEPERWAEIGSDRPYHYYGSFLHFYRFGTAFANGMLDMTPRYTMSSIRKDLDEHTAPLHRALSSKRYVEAHAVCKQLEQAFADDDIEVDDEQKLEVAHEVFGFLRNALRRDLDDAIAAMQQHQKKGDVYMLQQVLTATSRKYNGIDEYDEVAAPAQKRFADRGDRALGAEVRLGKTYYGMIDKLRKKRTKGRIKALEKLAEKNPDSPYGKAAAAAAVALVANENAKPRDAGSYLK